jgi:hypothetical protein
MGNHDSYSDSTSSPPLTVVGSHGRKSVGRQVSAELSIFLRPRSGKHRDGFGAGLAGTSLVTATSPLLPDSTAHVMF